jgi:hypothetical protein
MAVKLDCPCLGFVQQINEVAIIIIMNVLKISLIFATECALMSLLSGVSVGCAKRIVAPDAHYCICIHQRYARLFYGPLRNDPFQSA